MVRKHLLPTFSTVAMKDFSGELVQSFIADCDRNPKTIKNLIGTLRIMWNSAKAWDYVSHDPFSGLVLPKWDAPEQPVFSPEQVKRIIAAAEPPYDTVFWLVAQTGIRRGEVCALDVGHVNLTECVIVVKRNRNGRHITDNKSRKPRVFSISARLAQRLESFVIGRSPDEPLFVTAEGKRLHPDNFVKRKLKPLLKELGLEGGLHAFRHGNATVQDRLHTPHEAKARAIGSRRLAHHDGIHAPGWRR